MIRVTDRPIPDGDMPPTGGFRAAQRKTLRRLAWACVKGDIAEVQRLAAMTLTWGDHGAPQ